MLLWLFADGWLFIVTPLTKHVQRCNAYMVLSINGELEKPHLCRFFNYETYKLQVAYIAPVVKNTLILICSSC